MDDTVDVMPLEHGPHGRGVIYISADEFRRPAGDALYALHDGAAGVCEAVKQNGVEPGL